MDETPLSFFAEVLAESPALVSPPPLEDAAPSEGFDALASEAEEDSDEEPSVAPPFPFGAERVFFRA